MNDDFDWTADAVAHLRTLWAEGHTTAEIGRRIGVSKNAIVGKSHRLRLPSRPSPIGQGRTAGPRPPRRPPVPKLADLLRQPAPDSAGRAASPDPPKTALRLAAKIPGPPPVSIPAARTRGDKPCCWPIGHPGTPTFRFCDAPSLTSKPYCPEHAALAYVHPRDRRTTGAAEQAAIDA